MTLKMKVVLGAAVVLFGALYVFITFLTSPARQVSLSPDIIHWKLRCDGEFEWRLTEKDQVHHGYFFEGVKPYVESYRALLLVSENDGTTVMEITPHDGKYQTSSDEFPTGEAFLKARIFGNDAVRFTNSGKENRWEFPLLSSKVSTAQFDDIALCLQKNLPDIEKQLNTINQYPRKIGWIMLVDDSSPRDIHWRYPVFMCPDGGALITERFNVRYRTKNNLSVSASETYDRYTDALIGGIGLDGHVHDTQGFYTPSASWNTINIPHKGCKNSNGLSFENFIESLPDRIEIVDRATSTSDAL